MEKKEDRRRSPRISVVLKVEYSTAQDFLADYTCDASNSGLFIATNQDFKLGEIIHFSISFPGLLVPIDCKAKVEHLRKDNHHSQERLNGIGVSFIFDSTEQACAIQDLLQKFSNKRETKKESRESSPPFRVLLAEDNPLVLKMLHYGLKKFHASKMTSKLVLEVVEVENGLRAWEEISKNRVDLAIVDYSMPVMNGDQLIRKIREDPHLATTPIVAVSIGGREARDATYAAGADLFLDKPLMLAALIDSLQRLLRGRL